LPVEQPYVAEQILLSVPATRRVRRGTHFSGGKIGSSRY
jgi:hypothetical protein